MPTLPDFTCVSCGRPAGFSHGACPYCGEALREPAWRRPARLAALWLCTAGPALLVWVRGCATDLLTPRPRNSWDGLLLALGVGLLLLPQRLRGVEPDERRALAARVIGPLAGVLLLAAATLALLLAARFGEGWTPGTVVLAIAIAAALAVLPRVARLPSRGVAAGLLLAAAWRGLGAWLP